MRLALKLALVAAVCTAMASNVEAHGGRRCRAERRCFTCGTACNDCSPTPTYEDRTVTCYKAEWREKEVECTIYKRVPHEVVTPHKCIVMVPEWRDEKRTVTEYTRVPKEIERPVTTCCRVPCAPPCETSCGDGCDDGCGRRRCRLFQRRGCDTGCNYQVVTETHMVKCTVWVCVPVRKEVMVKVCSYKPTERTWETRCTVWECKPEVVKQKVKYCEYVPYTTTVKVPVCPTAPTCCN